TRWPRDWSSDVCSSDLILTPLIAAIAGKPDFSAFTATLNGGVIQYGLFLNALIAFIMVALAVYFFIVAPTNALAARMKRGEAPQIGRASCREKGECTVV